METPQQPPLSNKNKDIISSIKKDFEAYKSEEQAITSNWATTFQKPILFVLQWLAFFLGVAFIFLLLFVTIGGNEMASVIASKYFSVPTEQLSDQGLLGIKKLLNWMFFIMALLFALLGYSIMVLRKVANKYLSTSKLAQKIIKETHAKTQYLETINRTL
jgi:hypothetical protein